MELCSDLKTDNFKLMAPAAKRVAAAGGRATRTSRKGSKQDVNDGSDIESEEFGTSLTTNVQSAPGDLADDKNDTTLHADTSAVDENSQASTSKIEDNVLHRFHN